MEQEVSLIQMLDARERRVWHQQELLGAYGKPLVCFTMNIAGPVKDSPPPGLCPGAAIAGAAVFALRHQTAENRPQQGCDGP